MRRFSLVALGVSVFTVLFVGPWATAAFADKSIPATGQNCATGQVMTGGTFTLTNVTASQQIAVNTGTVRTYAPSSFSGGTATYNASFDAPLKSPPAVATVPNSWSGNFALTSTTCVAAKVPTVNPTVSACGVSPVYLSVRVTNNNPISTDFTINVSSHAAQTASLTKNETEEVTFQPMTRGGTYSLNVTGAGVTSSSTVAVDSCQVPPGPGPAPTTKSPPKTIGPGSPTSDASPETSLIEQPSSSANPSGGPSGAVAIDNVGEDNDDPFHTDSKMLSYWTTWLGLACCVLAVAVIIALIVWMIRRKRKADDEDED